MTSPQKFCWVKISDCDFYFKNFWIGVDMATSLTYFCWKGITFLLKSRPWEYLLHVLKTKKRQLSMNRCICLEFVSNLITIPCWMNDYICNSMLKYCGFKCISVIVFYLFYRNVTNKNSTKMDSSSARWSFLTQNLLNMEVTPDSRFFCLLSSA